MLRTLLIFLTMTGVATAQSYSLDFGIRGGLGANAFVDNPRCCTSPNPFVTDTFTDESRPATIGASVSLRLNAQSPLVFRVEAVRRQVGYTWSESLITGNSDSYSTTVARGPSWEFPVLVTYRLPGSTLRPFVGGGVGGGTMNLKVTHTFIMSQQFPTPIATYNVVEETNHYSLLPLYGVVGFEKRMSLLSLLPELRFRQDLQSGGSSAFIRKNGSQMEFLVGITFHPFHREVH